MNDDTPKLTQIDYHTPQHVPGDARRAMGLAGIVMCVVGYVVTFLCSLLPFLHASEVMTLVGLCFAALLYFLSLILAAVALAFLKGSRRHLAWSIALGILGMCAIGGVSASVLL